MATAEARARSRRAEMLFGVFGAVLLLVLGFAAILLTSPLNVIVMPIMVGTGITLLFWAGSSKSRAAMRGGSRDYFWAVLLQIGVPHMAIQAAGIGWNVVLDRWHPQGGQEIGGLAIVQMGVLLAFVPYFFGIRAIPALKGLWRDYEAVWKATRAVQGEAA